MQILKCLFFALGTICSWQAKVYPIQFSISETKVVDVIPEKTQDFASVVPGQSWTYIFDEEEEYFRDYQKSYFGFTWKKGGWDCMRHYEILANGCVPYFVGLEDCDLETMFFLPRELIFKAMNLPGVSMFGIDFDLFDKERYDEILQMLLKHTKEYLTARAIAQYVLETIGYQEGKKILFLLKETCPDYLPCTLLIGLKEVLGDLVVELPKLSYIYTNYEGEIRNLYGKGMSYTKILEDIEVDREEIEERIWNREFDYVFYGSVHRGCPYLDIVKLVYDEDEIYYFCGEDAHICEYKNLPHLFIREFEALK